jgi:hypothetical protein
MRRCLARGKLGAPSPRPSRRCGGGSRRQDLKVRRVICWQTDVDVGVDVEIQRRTSAPPSALQHDLGLVGAIEESLYKIGYQLGGWVKAFAFATVSNKDPFLSLPLVTDSLKLALNDTSSSSGRTGDLTPSTATTNQPPHRHIPTARAGMNLRAGPALSRADAYVCEAAAAYLGFPARAQRTPLTNRTLGPTPPTQPKPTAHAPRARRSASAASGGLALARPSPACVQISPGPRSDNESWGAGDSSALSS